MSAPPIVLVHGAWHGPWCWAQAVDRLEAAGHHVEVVTLPDHDRPGDHRRIWPTVSAYVQALGDAIDRCPARPILVGHSMGGYVVQRHLERHTETGAVLLASAPRWGVLPTTLRLLRRYPALTLRSLLTLDMWPIVGFPYASRQLFFGPNADDTVVATTEGKLQNESYLAFLTMTVRPPRPGRITTPCLVLAATEDAVFTVDEQRGLGRALSAPVEVLDGMGHDLMLDAGWETVVDRISAFAVEQAG